MSNTLKLTCPKIDGHGERSLCMALETLKTTKQNQAVQMFGIRYAWIKWAWSVTISWKNQTDDLLEIWEYVWHFFHASLRKGGKGGIKKASATWRGKLRNFSRRESFNGTRVSCQTSDPDILIAQSFFCRWARGLPNTHWAHWHGGKPTEKRVKFRIKKGEMWISGQEFLPLRHFVLITADNLCCRLLPGEKLAPVAFHSFFYIISPWPHLI